jgi:hypothetical protein
MWRTPKAFSMTHAQKRIVWPVTAGLTGTLLLASIYLGIMSIAEGPKIALDLFWADRFLIGPILIGFGVQAALYVILKKQLFVPISTTAHTGKLMGASGTASTFAMIACCAHHVTDVLPILGLTAAATFLGQYRTIFLYVGLGTTLLGIAVMLAILLRERRKVLHHLSTSVEAI